MNGPRRRSAGQVTTRFVAGHWHAGELLSPGPATTDRLCYFFLAVAFFAVFLAVVFFAAVLAGAFFAAFALAI